MYPSALGAGYDALCADDHSVFFRIVESLELRPDICLGICLSRFFAPACEDLVSVMLTVVMMVMIVVMMLVLLFVVIVVIMMMVVVMFVLIFIIVVIMMMVVMLMLLFFSIFPYMLLNELFEFL